MNEMVLKDALLEANNFIADSLPSGKYAFSYRVSRKIQKYIFWEMHPVVYRLKNVATVIILVILMSGTIILGSSEKVRAAVIGWLSNTFEGVFAYQGQRNSAIDISGYSMRDLVPNEFTYSELHSSMTEGEKIENYITPDDYFFSLQISKSEEGKLVQLLSDTDDKVRQVAKDNYIIDHYYNSDGTENAYVWQDESGTLFYIGGRISEQGLDKIVTCFLEKYKK